MRGRLLILGAGGHGRAVADVASSCDFEVVGFTDRAKLPGGVALLGPDEEALVLARAGKIDGAVVGVGSTTMTTRARLFHFLEESRIATPALVHPRAVVAASARIGRGSVVFAGAVIGAGVEILANAVVYSGAVVEHDCRIADHAYLSPGVILSGGVTVEDGAFIGAGAVAVPGVVIGKAAVVAAGAVVVTDVADGATVIGVPAKPRALP